MFTQDAAVSASSPSKGVRHFREMISLLFMFPVFWAHGLFQFALNIPRSLIHILRADRTLALHPRSEILPLMECTMALYRFKRTPLCPLPFFSFLRASFLPASVTCFDASSHFKKDSEAAKVHLHAMRSGLKIRHFTNRFL